MAVSSTYQKVENPTGVKIAMGALTFDSSYDTGGEAVTATQWGAVAVGEGRAPDFVILHPRETDTGGVDLQSVAWDKANNKVGVYWVDTTADDSPLDEVTAAQSEATFVVDFLAFWVAGAASTTT